MNLRWSRISLGYFLVIALAGLAMRASSFIKLPFEYEHLLHAHSHVAFQGWIYTVIFLITTRLFLKKEQVSAGKYSLQFYLTISVIAGILVSFSLQGYALFSIVFSSLFQVLNYWFIFKFLKDLKTLSPPPVSVRFIRSAMWLGLISTLGPWMIAVLAARGLANSELYHSTIYFFLHFQYNGWFLFTAFGIACFWMEQLGENPVSSNAKRFFLFSLIAVFPGYLLSLTNMSFGKHLAIPGIIAVFLQFVALFYLIRYIREYNFLNQSSRSWVFIFMLSSFSIYALKTVLQVGSLLPTICIDRFNNRFILMFYLHLSLIGVLSFFFIAALIKLKALHISFWSASGFVLLLIGFVLSETVLLMNGTGFFTHPVYLLTFSACMVLGILFIFLSTFNKSNHYD